MASQAPPSWLPDFNTCTRQEYTTALLSQPIPENASNDYRQEVSQHQTLLELLFSDPAMDPNRDQKYMTPAASKNKVYFLWDYVQRTLAGMMQIDPSLPASQKATWAELLGRSAFGSNLILDNTGKMAYMFPGDSVTFSDKIRDHVKMMMQAERDSTST